MGMTEKVVKQLGEDDQGDGVRAILKHVKQLVSQSRSDMSNFYPKWDDRHRTFNARHLQDKVDREVEKKGEPGKQIVPMSYAQIDTFIAFVMMVIFQKKTVFEFDPTGAEDWPLKTPAELIIDRDMKESNQKTLTNQFLLDVGKFGLGAIKCMWKEEFVYVPVQAPGKQVLGKEVASGEIEWVKVPKFMGNRVINISPYRVFPDTRLPLSRYQEGEFIASEDEMPRVTLKKLQKDGMYAGVDKIPGFTSEDMKHRGDRGNRFSSSDVTKIASIYRNVVVTEVIVDIIPSDWNLTDNDKLEDQDFPVRYIVAYANDNRVIRMEPLGSLSQKFPIFLGQYSPDMHELVNNSLADVISRLQETVDWFINSRMESVRRTISNQVVADPAGVDINSIKSNSRIILMKKQAARMGVDRFIKQLNVQDVTASHMNDAAQMTNIAQQSSGVNDNAMGQYNGGRRSAYESRIVTQGAGARMGKVIAMLWEAVFQPLGQTMLINHRQELDQDTFVRIVGEAQEEEMPTEQVYALFHGDPIKLVQGNDTFAYDGSLPSEKGYVAQSLQEILMMLLQNPMSAQQFNLDPKKMLEEIYALRGVGTLLRFSFSFQQMQQQALLNAQQNGQQPGAPNPAVGSGQGAVTGAPTPAANASIPVAA